jgi:T5orf172 domain
MATCPVKGCENDPITKCFECGKRVCEQHVKTCERNPKHRMCPKHWKLREEEGQHVTWCKEHCTDRAPLKIKKTLGTGSQWVYVYYSPRDEELATLKKETVWLCKIGCCKGPPDGRIVQQGARTALAGNPVVALGIQTDERKRLERLLHAALAYAGKHDKSGGGAEWFRTNPTEVAILYRGLSRVTGVLYAAH